MTCSNETHANVLYSFVLERKRIRPKQMVRERERRKHPTVQSERTHNHMTQSHNDNTTFMRELKPVKAYVKSSAITNY